MFSLLGVGWPASSVVGLGEGMLLAGTLGGTFATGAVALAKRAELPGPEERRLLK